MKELLKIKNSRLKIPRFKIFNLKSSIKNEKGLTLLEIAISLAILSIALVALANLFPIGLRASRRASNFSAASILAQRVIENIKRAASIYNVGDDGDISGTISNTNDIGYFELVNQNINAYPFNDNGLTITDEGLDANSFRTYLFQYNDTSMKAYVKSVDWDANNNGQEGWANGDWNDVLLSQKVYVAIYWIEGEQDRADTFITYISNPFYEKYR